MCENNSLEKNAEHHQELKQVMVHSQHARILKEDDEIWISSEDLNTENSSDEDKSKTKLAYRKKLKPKNRKRSSPNIRLQRPSISSVASTSQQLDNRLLMPQTTEDPHSSRSTDDSRTSDEEFNVPSITPECLSKRLSLEDWRPMRGSLTISSLEETATAAGDSQKSVNETGNFFESMMTRLKTLKACPVLSSHNAIEELNEAYKKTFKYLKNTPDVKRCLEAIRAMDQEISQTIDQYKEERQQRLSTEFEVCKEIVEHKVGEEHGTTEAFLQMSGFDQNLVRINEDQNDASDEEAEGASEHMGDTSCKEQQSTSGGGAYTTNFIKKNKQAAKTGTMSYFSLTDEEKARIEKLMEDFERDIDKYNLNDAELKLPSIDDDSSTLEAPVNQDKQKKQVKFSKEKNAFVPDNVDRARLERIDKELEEKFVKDEQWKEKYQKQIPPISDEEYWKIDNLNKTLKRIDQSLETLQAKYASDDYTSLLQQKDDNYKNKLDEIMARGVEDEQEGKENFDYKEKVKELMAKWLNEEEEDETLKGNAEEDVSDGMESPDTDSS